MNRLLVMIFTIGGFLIIFIIGCKHLNKPIEQKRDDDSIAFQKWINDCVKYVDKEMFYSFDNSYFNKKEIQNLFNPGILIDSAYEKHNSSDSIFYYTFKDSCSKVVFDLYNISKGKRDFFISGLELKSDIFKFNNGIKINMSRSDFYKALKMEEADCDELFITLKNTASQYYIFEFRNDSLKLIKLKYKEL